MKLVSSDRGTTIPFIAVVVVVGIAISFAIDNIFDVESVLRREGVCEREGAFEEHRDDDGLCKCSIGISSEEVGRELMRGLDSLERDVPE